MKKIKPQIPTAPILLKEAIEKLVSVRPKSLKHLDKGTYSYLIKGLESESIVAIDHIAKECVAVRLPLAESDALTELCRSEFDTLRVSDATSAIGEVILIRRVVHYDQSVPPIAIADASDEASIYVLGQALTESLNEHVINVFDDSLGIGAHLEADVLFTPFISSSSTIQEILDALTLLTTELTNHLNNDIAHKSTDIKSIITAKTPFASNVLTSYSSNNPSAQLSILKYINNLKAVINNHYQTTAKAGTIKIGSIWQVQSDSTQSPPIVGAQYNSLYDTVITVGQEQVTVIIQSTISGEVGNLPQWITGGQNRTVNLISTLFDSSAIEKFSTNDLRAAGGLTTESDDILRISSKAKFKGKNSPVNDALIAGALEDGRMAHVAILEDLNKGIAYIYAADNSWSQSDKLLNEIHQSIKSNYEGAGCKTLMASIKNKLIRLNATITLRDSKNLADMTDLISNLQVAFTNYFDNRSDFYVWNYNTLKSIGSTTDRKILACSEIYVLDEDGLILTEPTQPNAGDTITHYWLLNNAINLTFTSAV